ncbi:MAG: sugar ABC transporter permease [Anaerolineae bacterium]|nr:sugar ABC transporter permease [Anaerolineae bacterium]
MSRILHPSYQTRLRLLMLPYQIAILVLVVIPALLAFSLAFFHYDALSPPQFAGLLNFRLVFSDELFLLSVQHTLALVIVAVPLRVAGAFLLARWLQHDGRLISWVRGAVYLPAVIPAAAYALIWLWVLNPLYGPLNLLLQSAGLAPPPWFADATWAKPGLILLLLWQIGEGFLVSLAALYDIPPELEEAARVDGAGSGPILRHIILPLIAPILLLLTLRDVVLVLQGSFTAVWLTTQGGPYYSTYTLPQFIYEQGFDLFSFGTASAALWVLYALTGGLVLLLLIVARQWQVGATEDYFL